MFTFKRAIVVALTAAMLIPLGQSVPTVLAKSKTKTISNSDQIDIVTFETHSSQINVSGFKKGKIQDVNISLHNFSHTLPDDVDVLLVAPGGRNAIIMSDAGAADDAGNLNITLDDEAAQPLPDNDPLSSGNFQPTNHGNGDIFINPNAPTPSGDVALSTFDGINPNGAWTLYVYDDNAGDNGAIADGWSLQIKAKVKK